MKVKEVEARQGCDGWLRGPYLTCHHGDGIPHGERGDQLAAESLQACTPAVREVCRLPWPGDVRCLCRGSRRCVHSSLAAEVSTQASTLDSIVRHGSSAEQQAWQSLTRVLGACGACRVGCRRHAGMGPFGPTGGVDAAQHIVAAGRHALPCSFVPHALAFSTGAVPVLLLCCEQGSPADG